MCLYVWKKTRFIFNVEVCKFYNNELHKLIKLRNMCANVYSGIKIL
jgi:hypothetical protein